MIVLRTVKNGKVKINGRWYTPPVPYDERFENHRLAFGIYKYEPDVVSLWGTEKQFRGEEDKDAWDLLTVGGYLIWTWWKQI